MRSPPPALDPAYLVARAAGRLSRRLGRGGGTSLPGNLLLRWRPDAIRRSAGSLTDGSVVLSATNGKTTTASLLAACLRADGRQLVTNPSGANLLSGVATALMSARRTSGPQLGLFEVDEAALPAVVDQLAPRVVLLMNLFRDQLDRYGELEEIAIRWRQMLAQLPATTTVILNADDPAVAGLGDAHPNVMYFGIEDPSPALAGLPHAADSKRCRRCGQSLVYDVVFLGHLGHWRCEHCGWSRPRPAIAATQITLDGLEAIEVEVSVPTGRPVLARIALPGLHNAYNATAAVAAATVLGIGVDAIEPALASSQAAFGRSERVRLNGRELVLLLIKNPAGANETIRTVLLDPEPLDLLLALNDRTADGRDVSWIWDVDYEPIVERVRSLTVTGDRAHDLALRFRYGGLDPGKLTVVGEVERSLDVAMAAAAPGRPLYVLPTYTAMLDLRQVLVRRGAVEAFWHGR